jgi:WD40 repeat protein
MILHRRIGAINVVILALLSACSLARGQYDESRREPTTPGLVLNTGSRTSACDVLTFTNEGQFLFATGDDKVVRTWKFTPQGLETIPDPAPPGSPQPVLRWASYRERRGNIYAAAVSPDANGRYLVVGGLGVTNSQFAVLDRYSGEIVNAVRSLSTAPKLGSVSIWSVAFSPSGDQVACGTGGGSVWVWDWRKEDAKPVQVGQHDNPRGGDYNYVRFLTYQKNQLVSADENGGVYRWSLGTKNPTKGGKIFAFTNQEKTTRGIRFFKIRFFAMSPNAEWLAAALEDKRVEVRSLRDGGAIKTIEFESGTYPNAVAFDAQSTRLAVALRTVDPQGFYKEIAHQVVVYDVTKSPRVTLHITPTFRVEALAFHPGGRHLATAGGNHHEVSLYDLASPARPLGRPIAGPGECIYGVSISKDGRYVGFQTERLPNPAHPNYRGMGPRRVFDLKRRVFTKDADVAWAPPADTSPDRWEVVTSPEEVKVKLPEQWFVRGPGLGLQPIPWDTKIDEYPRCYLFLPQTKTHPPRLVVGTGLYAANIYELTPQGPFRARVLTGHDSEVTAMALSADGKRLVTASRVQTITGWSLEDWPRPNHPQLGAHFYLKGGKLRVGTVAQGSPIWEAGLSTDDEVVLLVVGGLDIVYNRTGKYSADKGSAERALAALEKPMAGVELYFGCKRTGSDQLFEYKTTLRERPIWRLFPTKDNEWVLWRYQDFLYDTSTRGDALIGWQRNMLDDKGEANVKGTPAFYRAEQFRKYYHNPEKVSQTVLGWSRTEQGRSDFIDIEPPNVEVLVDGSKTNKVEVKDNAFRLTVKIAPQSGRQNQEITRVILWINDFQFLKWQDKALQKHIVKKKDAVGLERGVFTIEGLAVPPEVFRSGENILFLQCYNKAEVRGESRSIIVKNTRPRPQGGTLHGLFIGVGDYAKSRPRQIGLGAPLDAEVLAEVWDRNRGKQYRAASIGVLKDNQVTPARVLREFDKLAATVKPDDLLVFHLGGHGVSTRKLVAEVTANVKALKLTAEQQTRFNQQREGLSPFLFLCGDFDFLRVRDTSISLDDLYDRLVKLPCHKLITLDACNAAAIDPTDPKERKGTDIIRFFTRDGVGPIIFAACRAEESAIEAPGFVTEPAAGLFAQAIVKAIQEDFAKSKKNRLEPGEMFTDLKNNVEAWVNKLKADPANKDISQNPQYFLPVLERNLAILVGKQ